MTEIQFKEHIRSVPDFPKPGILFYDISTLLANATAWSAALDTLERRVAQWQPDILLGIESRGFLLAAPLADRLGVGFSMIRKPGKLPGETCGYDYELEYGTDRLEIQTGAVSPGMNAVILDDLLATGGTLSAAIGLTRSRGARAVGAACLIELAFLGGRGLLNKKGANDTGLFTLMTYDH